MPVANFVQYYFCDYRDLPLDYICDYREYPLTHPPRRSLRADLVETEGTTMELANHTAEITFDDTAGVYEAWLVDADGNREWIGAYDSREEASAAIAKAGAR